MRNLSELVRMMLTPSLAIAQSSETEPEHRGTTYAGRAIPTANTRTAVALERTRVLRGLTAKARDRAERTFQAARQNAVPEGPLITAMLEAWATATMESQIIRAQQRALARLETSKEAMARAGRSHPGDEAISHGASILARGVTAVQLEELVRRSPSNRSLLRAFETLTQLLGNGVPAQIAVAKVCVRLETLTSERGIRALSLRLVAGVKPNADAEAAVAGSSTR
jgi:hypothetical protein